MPISKKQSVSLDIHALIDASPSLDDGAKAYWHERVEQMDEDHIRQVADIFLREQERYGQIMQDRNRKIQSAYATYVERLDRETTRQVKTLYRKAEVYLKSGESEEMAALLNEA